MKIVAVTACPTGIAHTYMAQAAIEKECYKRQWPVQVETQGAMGIENELSQRQIDEADVVILAIAVKIEGEERFVDKKKLGKLLIVDPGEAIRFTSRLLEQAEQL